MAMYGTLDSGSSRDGARGAKKKVGAVVLGLLLTVAVLGAVVSTPAARSAAVAVFDAAAPAAALQPTAADVAKKKAEALEAKAEQLAMELAQKRLELVSAVTHASQQAGETKKVTSERQDAVVKQMNQLRNPTISTKKKAAVEATLEQASARAKSITSSYMYELTHDKGPDEANAAAKSAAADFDKRVAEKAEKKKALAAARTNNADDEGVPSKKKALSHSVLLGDLMVPH